MDFFVKSIAYKRNSSGITEYMNMHPPIKRLVTALHAIILKSRFQPVMWNHIFAREILRCVTHLDLNFAVNQEHGYLNERVPLHSFKNH